MYIVSGEDRYDGEIEKEFDNFHDALEVAERIREEGGWADVFDKDGIVEI